MTDFFTQLDQLILHLLEKPSVDNSDLSKELSDASLKDGVLKDLSSLAQILLSSSLAHNHTSVPELRRLSQLASRLSSDRTQDLNQRLERLHAQINTGHCSTGTSAEIDPLHFTVLGWLGNPSFDDLALAHAHASLHTLAQRALTRLNIRPTSEGFNVHDIRAVLEVLATHRHTPFTLNA